MSDTSGCRAIVYVDGEEFIRCADAAEGRRMFDETVRRIGGEVALSVYKPRYGMWLRERLSISASKPQ